MAEPAFYRDVKFTSTKAPTWQAECEKLRETEPVFELRDVTDPDHKAFVAGFSVKHDLYINRRGNVVRFAKLSHSR